MRDSSNISDSRQQRFMGIALACAAVFFFTGIDVTAKWLAPRIGVFETTWFRYFSAFCMVSTILNPWRVPGVLTTKRPWLQGIRGLCLLFSTVMNFIALQYLQLAQTVSIMFLAPILVALLSGPLLGEWVGPRRMAAIAVGFLGILVVTRPGMGIIHPAALLSIAGTCAYAVLLLMTRRLAAADGPETIMLYSTSVGAIVLAPVIFFIWIPPHNGMEWTAILLCGLSGSIGHWLLIQAQRRAPANVLAPFLYTQVIWMVGSGILFFDERPDKWTLIGAMIVIGSGLYILHRERLRSRRERQNAA